MKLLYHKICQYFNVVLVSLRITLELQEIKAKHPQIKMLGLNWMDNFLIRGASIELDFIYT